MALSSSESELLTETCTNMNIAANTCREVLEMLRNLGNTGVVDIATHNNAATAHANATNLVKLDSSGNFFVGQLGQYSNYPGNYPYRITPEGNYIRRILESGGISDPKQYLAENFYGLTNSQNELLSSSELTSSGNQIEVYRCFFYAKASDQDINGSMCYWVGSRFINPFSIKASHWGFGCSDEDGQWSHRFMIAHNYIAPYYSSGLSVGLSIRPFDTAYFNTAATTTSDRREKSGVTALDAKALNFIKDLRPVQYTVKNGRQNILETDGNGNATNVEVVPGTRRHWGLIAQEVQEALVSAGYDPSDCAVWSLADKNDPDSKQALRYEELIAPMIKVIQQQQERIEALERKVA